MPFSAGQKIGTYEIVAPLGAGGMGEVYRAADTRLGREVAIKFSNERFSDRFDREARVIASFNHPNICTLHDVGPNYLVMELVEGPTLADRIKQGPIPYDEAINVAGQIVDALEAAHEKGIVHRDLKPANIKITPDGKVKVLDFGLAYASGMPAVAPDNSPTLTAAQTQAGIILGTAAYMSPEQAKGKTVDKRADIWAFGVVLYEMLTGKRLFAGETTTEILAAVIERQPRWDDVPENARPLLQRCLEKDPKRRLRDIGEAMVWLENPPMSAPADSARARNRWMWPGIAALAAAAAVSLAVAFYYREAPRNLQPSRLQIPVPENLSFNPGTAAAISPDGKWIAFPAIGPDKVAHMWIRALDSLDVKQLPGADVIPLAPPPFWSLDSHFLTYGDSGKLKKIDIAGGPPQTVCDIPTIAQGGSWNQDGVILFGANGPGLMLCPAGGGQATVVTRPTAGETTHRWPQFLPDGRHFLYFRSSSKPENSGIFVGSIDVKPDEQNLKPLLVSDREGYYVPAEDGGGGWLLFMRETSLLAQRFDPTRLQLTGDPIQIAGPVGSFAGANYGMFSVAKDGSLVYRGGGSGQFQLTWMDTQGKVVGTLGDSTFYGPVAISPDGARVAATVIGTNVDIWMLDVARGTNTRLTFDPGVDRNPVWSPDGSRIVFASNRNGHYDLYEKAATGAGDDRILLKTDEDKTPTSWSRDGRFLLYFASAPKTGNDLWVLPLEGDRKPIPFLRTQFQESQGQFSTEATPRWIAYNSNESGLPEVYVRPFSPTATGETSDSGGKWMVSKGGGLFVHWRSDGKQLFYVGLNGQQMAVDLATGKTFEFGVPKALFSVQLALGSNLGNDVNREGTRFLFTMTQGGAGPPPPFTVLLNWQAALKK